MPTAKTTAALETWVADLANHHETCPCDQCRAKRKPQEPAQQARSEDFSPLGPDGKPISEAAFQAKVIELAESLGWERELIFHPWRSDRSTPGFPDLVLCKPPRLIFAELKTDKAPPPPPEQQKWLDALGACGNGGYLWRPRHWSDIVTVLSR